ncbi:solute carrier organic anion transporter family member 74D isoform X1 [Diorhabda sublineata]|uniref:solute carrier organic anion transporter family member 74D isoform X1 n=1 Tax=Diorhabda sublineata TaxID=1163346 RepID=UPI0024E133E9|nr:solute carrier organic anion transporter family member 74D isoform X1 [Diorhabda sublineata]XP_056647132.1 solute carrier organic anion transporter family member 74D isoform X1 [Diorhabda sublineata]
MTEDNLLENHRMLSKISNNNCPTNEIPDEQSTLSQECNGRHRDEEIEMECGLGPCAPNWLQKFASKQSFLIVFCLAWVLQGMYHTYFVSAITTIEKLFQIQSKITGIIMSATEIGQIGSSLLLTYYGGQGHRPKWIAWGMILFAMSSLTCSLPHFIYGRHLINANELTGVFKDPNICKVKSNTSFLLDYANLSFASNLSTSTLENCQNEAVTSSFRLAPSVTNIVLAIFFISLLGVGMGQTAVYTLGIPYIDDNVASKESPLYFAITIGVRILGPALGFIVGSLCTSVYADLSVKPQFKTSDPRWVGAWWLGLVLISFLLMIASFAMFAFPKRLTGSKQPVMNPQSPDQKQPTIKDFPKTVKRLLKNDILMYRTASSVLHILPIAGLYTFLPKYLETQFRLPTPSANMISGVGGILVMGLGIIISGVFILRMKPNARFVAAWIASTAVLYALGMGLLMFIGCPMNDLAGLMNHGFDTKQLNCNSSYCDCDKDKFTPICGQDGKTYLSPCHAGCLNYTENEGQISQYSDCMCLNMTLANITINENHLYGNATIGYCDQDCDSFILYIILFSIFVFIHSTGEVGSMLLILRCVDPRDKAMALGLIQFAIGLFGNVPCPIVYGAVVDSACLVWKTACGEKGACGLYDSDVFRMFYHGTTGFILLCAFVVDVIVWYKAGKINFVDEQAVFEEELHSMTGKMKNEPE